MSDLGDLKGCGPARQTMLRDAGFPTINDVAQADVEALLEAGLNERTAEKLISQARTKTVLIQTGTEVVEEYNDKAYISSGMLEFDELIGGGYEEGFLYCLYGPSGKGKTQLAFQSLVGAVEDTGRPAVYIETEPNRYRPERLQSLLQEEEDLEQIHRIPVRNIDQQEAAYDALMEAGTDYSVIVIDSFTARFRTNDDFTGRQNLGKRSEVMGRHLEKLETVAASLKCPIILTAQVYGNPDMYGAPFTVWGGMKMEHTVGAFVKMTGGKGSLVKATLHGHPGLGEAEVYLNIGENDIVAMKDGE